MILMSAATTMIASNATTTMVVTGRIAAQGY
jgi:hypothetical protein